MEGGYKGLCRPLCTGALAPLRSLHFPPHPRSFASEGICLKMGKAAKNGESSLKWLFPYKLRFLVGTPRLASALPVSGSATDPSPKMGGHPPPPTLSPSPLGSLPARGHPPQPKGLYLWDRFALLPPTTPSLLLYPSEGGWSPRTPLLQRQRGRIGVRLGDTRQTSSEDFLPAVAGFSAICFSSQEASRWKQI